MAERDPELRPSGNYPAYEQDYAAWLDAQISALREHRFADLDLDHLLDEVGDLGLSNFKAFVSAIRVVLLHMLKWDLQEDYRSRSWSDSIDEHRRRLLDELAGSPSYRARLDAAIVTAYRQARAEAAAETKLPLRTFPETCPFSWTDICERPHGRVSDDFDPEIR